MLDYTKWVLASTLVAFSFQLNPPVAATTPTGRVRQPPPCYLPAAKALREAQDIVTSAPTRGGEGIPLNESQRIQNMRLGIVKLEQASKMLQECNENLAAAVGLYYAAEAYSKLGEKQKALEYYKRSLSLAQTDKTPQSTSTQNFILRQMREIYSDLEKNKKR
jgi:tetratricopeptide (TPR) repeat protein